MKIVEKEEFNLMKMPAYITLSAADEAAETFKNEPERKKKQYLLDMADVPHLYSSGIRLIVQLYKQVKELNGKMFIVNANEEVISGIQAANLDKEIPVFDSMVEYELYQADESFGE